MRKPYPFLFCAVLMTVTQAQETPVQPKTLIGDIHRTTITPASDALFKAESSPPKSEQSWNALERNATILAKSASALAAKDVAKDQKEWQLFARALRTEANSAAIAARQKDLDELIAANGRVVAICESCHNDYRDHGHGMTSDR